MASVACANCAHLVPVGARFCPNCGAAVAKRGPAEERRVVTVLFADLVGSTALAEHRDPEEVKHLIDACFERLVADIEAFGGRVDKLLGDAIVALFGAPVAHEDDAERAVRAALRMHETLSAFTLERGEVPMQMRIGINTGEVLVGVLAGTDYTAMGDVVNAAARLQALAPPGRVLAGAATVALLSPSITTEAFGEAVLRGRQQVEQPALIVHATAAGSRPARADVAFVGRRAELGVLEAALAVVRTGRAAVVSICAEAGAGKTRLVDEFLGGLSDGPVVISMAGAPYGERNVWGPIAGGLSSLFDLPAGVDADGVLAALSQRAEQYWGLAAGDPDLDRFGAAVLHALGLPSEYDRLDPAAASARLAATVTDMMRRHAETRLTIVWFDNAQWASTRVREVFAVIARSLVDLPFLLVLARRPEDSEHWPPTDLDRSMTIRFPLGPLPASDARALVSEMMTVDDEAPAPSVVEAIVVRGGGNALFLVELAAVAACGGPHVALSGSLRALIAARLDQLPPRQRAIIENAAVLGSGESLTSLEYFAAELHQSFTDDDVGALVADGLLEVDDGRWRFRTELVREVAYQTLTKRTRALRHAGVAASMRAKGYPQGAQIAHHSASAAELLAELGTVPGMRPTIKDEAIADLTASARLALAEGQAAATDKLATRALDLGVDDAPTKAQLLLLRASAGLVHRHFPAAARDAAVAWKLAESVGDEVSVADARRRLGTAKHHLGELVEARQHLDAAIATFRAGTDRQRLAEGLRTRGFAEVFGGSLAAAQVFLDEALAIYGELNDERGLAWTHHNMAWVAFQTGDADLAERRLAEAHQRFAGLDDRSGMHWADGLLAYVYYFQGRAEQAERLAVQVEAEAVRWGDQWARLMMQTLRSYLWLWQGRLTDAEGMAARALAGFREVGDRYGIMQALAPLSRAQAALGRVDDAERGSEELVALGHAFGELGLAVQGAAGVAVHLGQAERALVLADQVIERQHGTGASTDEGRVLRALALVQLGRVDEASIAIDPIDVEGFSYGRSARALVRAVGGDVDDARADAEHVVGDPAATYFDRMIALLALAVAAGPDEREDRISALAALASEVGDATFLGVVEHWRSSDAVTGPANGWQRLVATAPV